MLFRLQVSGFKNLADVDVRFGPLTCFVGRNGVGKSNLLDAIHLLSLLAEMPIQDAAASVRRPAEGVFQARDLLRDGLRGQEMRFVADMLVPREVVDDFGRKGQATTTLLRYEVSLRYVEEPAPRLELTHERLSHHKKGEAREVIGFPRATGLLKGVEGERRGGDFISTVAPHAGAEGGKRRRQRRVDTPQILLHQDGGSRGQPFPPGDSPRTVLGGTNSIEYPTVLAARREMLSWRFLHLEPSSMRATDPFGATPHVSDRGGRIAATLDQLARAAAADVKDDAERARLVARVWAEATNRLRELDPDVRDLRVERDEVRQQLILLIRLDGSSDWLGPRGISDGTLRYLALTVMQMDRAHHGLLCLEEPENGMHPSRIPLLTRLLEDFAVDPGEDVGPDNPLRQVIVNTHSPDVVKQLNDADILFVEEVRGEGGRRAQVYAVEGTWRAGLEPKPLLVPRRRVPDFIGGAPLGEGWRARQLELAFGTA